MPEGATQERRRGLGSPKAPIQITSRLLLTILSPKTRLYPPPPQSPPPPLLPLSPPPRQIPYSHSFPLLSTPYLYYSYPYPYLPS